MFQIVALVCALASNSCDRMSARDVVILGEVDSNRACLWNAQMRAGSVAALRKLGASERIVFVCERRQDDD